MGNTAKKSLSTNDLHSRLLSTLDEGVFFVELSKHLNKEIKADDVCTYLIKDESAISLSKNNRILKRKEEISLESGVLAQVSRSNRAYYSNNIESDPLFSKEDGRKAVLFIPVSVEGVVVGIIQFSTTKTEKEYSREDINFSLKHISELETPIKNLNLYLSAKFLNEVLTEQLNSQATSVTTNIKNVEQEYLTATPSIVNKSEVMIELIELADKVAKSEVSILLEGQNGTGKDRLARYIHGNSTRSGQGLFSINCASISARELEVELFGIENGHESQEGIIEKLSEGTLVLRNIHALHVELQAKLLNLIKDRIAFRVNGSTSFSSNVRIISTTHQKLADLVEQGLFRQDLYYCLNMMTIVVPTLSERAADIDNLADEILNGNRRSDEHKSLTPGALKLLKEYQWKGNISELKTILEQAYILASGIMIDATHLCLENREIVEEVEQEQDLFEFDEEITLEELERRFICSTLERLGGNKTKTAKALGITVKTLYNKLHSYDMIAKEA